MNNNTINLSGKMFAVGELVRRGFTIKKQNLVFNKQALVNVSKRGKQFKIEVRVTNKVQKSWRLTTKYKSFVGKNCFYVFVSLNKLGIPEYYIVKADIVESIVTKEHGIWQKSHGKSSIRVFKDENDKYINKWNTIK